jgi:hypothetical protein
MQMPLSRRLEMIDWDKEVITNTGQTVVCLDRNFKCATGTVTLFKVLPLPHLSSTGYDFIGLYFPNGKVCALSGYEAGYTIRNKPVIVEKWIILWKDWPSAWYYETEEEANYAASISVRTDLVKVMKVTWEE